jgi:DNA-binding LacI/PurR family transcriptional regulator
MKNKVEVKNDVVIGDVVYNEDGERLIIQEVIYHDIDGVIYYTVDEAGFGCYYEEHLLWKEN